MRSLSSFDLIPMSVNIYMFANASASLENSKASFVPQIYIVDS